MAGTIGILGGMGPLATADLFTKIVKLPDAKSDGEHIRVYMDNNPRIPDRTRAILHGGDDPLPEMQSALANLVQCQPSCIVVPCNTAHFFLDRLRSQTDVPILDMLKLTAEKCARDFAGKTAGIWATSGTIQTGLYSRALESAGVPYILPDEDEQKVLMDLIYRVKSGEVLHDKSPIEGLMRSMAKADYFILGCTELPLVISQLNPDGDFVDPTEVLARSAIEFCGYKTK